MPRSVSESVSAGVAGFALTIEGRVVWLDEAGIAYSLAVGGGGQIITRQPLHLPPGSCEPISYEAACALLLQIQLQRETYHQPQPPPQQLPVPSRSGVRGRTYPHPLQLTQHSTTTNSSNRALPRVPSQLLHPPILYDNYSGGRTTPARAAAPDGLKNWLPQSGLDWLKFMTIVGGLFMVVMFLINNLSGSRGSSGIGNGTGDYTSAGVGAVGAGGNVKVVQGANGKKELHYQVVRSTEYNPIAKPTISCNVFEQFLVQNNSPAAPQAGEMCAAIVVGGGDPAVALGFFEKESNLGKAGTTDAGNGNIERNMGNIRCNVGAPHSLAKRCRTTATNGKFNAYDTWAAGAADWARLLQFYKSEWKLVKLEDVLYKYAPWADRNNPPAYVRAVKQRVDKLRAQYWATVSP
jgi:hypothetical protein